MTENKRFKLKYINEQHISANLYDDKTFIGSIGIGEELIVELLNDLSEENEQLKSKNRGLQSELGIFKEDVTHSNQIINKLNDENEQLKSEIKGMEELLKSYRKTIKYDAELLADATKNGYLPPLEDWKKGDGE